MRESRKPEDSLRSGVDSNCRFRLFKRFLSVDEKFGADARSDRKRSKAPLFRIDSDS
jgi:hypothetical protein